MRCFGSELLTSLPLPITSFRICQDIGVGLLQIGVSLLQIGAGTIYWGNYCKSVHNIDVLSIEKFPSLGCQYLRSPVHDRKPFA